MLKSLKEATNYILDTDRLVSSLNEDGYLFFRNILSSELAIEVRRDMETVLCKYGVLGKDGSSEPVWKGFRPHNDEEIRINSEISHLESTVDLTEQKELISIFERLFGGPVYVFNMRIPRFYLPAYQYSRLGSHQDFFFWRDSQNLHVAWIPLMTMNESVGGLALAEDSHKVDFDVSLYEYVANDSGPKIREERLAEMTWISAEYRPGDLLILDGKIIHKGLPNTSDRIRFSLDRRYQPKNSRIDWAASLHDDGKGWYRDQVIRPAVSTTGLTGDEAEKMVWEMAIQNPIRDRITKAMRSMKK